MVRRGHVYGILVPRSRGICTPRNRKSSNNPQTSKTVGKQYIFALTLHTNKITSSKFQEKSIPTLIELTMPTFPYSYSLVKFTITRIRFARRLVWLYSQLQIQNSSSCRWLISNLKEWEWSGARMTCVWKPRPP